MRIALARCCDLPEPDMDEVPTVAALRDAGHTAECLNWDDPHAEPAANFDAVVIRAAWNYINDVRGFLNWVDNTARVTTLLNSPADVRWNVHKGYLTVLESAGVPIVPTRVVRTGQSLDVARLVESEGWPKVVIKPAVGAGSFLTHCFEPGDAEAQTFLDRFTKSQDMLVQRYMPSVESAGTGDHTGGERALVVIDGELTHAVEKSPRFADDDESVRSAPIDDADRAFAAKVLSAEDFGDPLYARVDVMRSDDGELLLSELELIEPSLFFPFGEAGLTRFVAALERRIAR
jgi:glutathione synthase/RimK-type ligase-like ATP-grasp enzyme